MINANLATTTSRVVATIVDIGILIFISVIISILGGVTTSLFSIILVPIVTLYHLGFEYFNKGQSPGKMMMKLRVIRLDGKAPTMEDLALRWIFRMLDIIGSLGLIAIVSTLTTRYSQRLGDVIAQTTVIDAKRDTNIGVDSLKKLSTNQPKVWSYPKVEMYEDHEMLLIKQAVIRYEKYPSPNNRKNLYTLANKIRQDLRIDKTNQSEPEFLKDVLKEYVQLTRQ